MTGFHWYEIYVAHRESWGQYQIRERSQKAAERLAQVLFARELNICWFNVDVEHTRRIS